MFLSFPSLKPGKDGVGSSTASWGAMCILVVLVNTGQMVLASSLGSSGSTSPNTLTSMKTSLPFITSTSQIDLKPTSTTPAAAPKVVATETIGFHTTLKTIPTANPSASTSPNIGGRIVDPSFFYTSPMVVICPDAFVVMQRYEDVGNGVMQWSAESGMPQSEWARTVRLMRTMVDHLDARGSGVVRGTILCCESLLCNENGQIIPNPNSVDCQRMSAWDPARCTYISGCYCYAQLGQPLAVAEGHHIPTLRHYQEAIDRIPESVRAMNQFWTWTVDPRIARYQGQALGFTPQVGVNVAAAGDPPFYLEFAEDGRPRPNNYGPGNSDEFFDFGKWDDDQFSKQRSGFNRWDRDFGGSEGSGGIGAKKRDVLPQGVTGEVDEVESSPDVRV
ncbi:hypothetical protein TWF481_003849 [Arthrobotrys musiformis]|uniref:Uncharacterized protein n=1 Tax=Arthrobotrys musiformis TaxID=47236 RepID=A0AAV9WIS3_9PEZI